MPDLSDSVQPKALGYTRAMSYSPIGYLGLGALSGSWGQLVAKDGYRYQLTDEDVLWGARMLYGEGGSDLPAVLWATAQRFAGIPMRRRLHGTYTAMMRAWSEPLMAARAAGGSYCAGSTSSRCAPNLVARRTLIQSLPWDGPYPSGTSASRWEEAKRVVTDWAQAKVPNSVPKAVDMGATTLTPPAGEEIVKRAGGNIFYSTAESRRWPSDQVTLHHDGRVAGPSISGIINAAPYIGVAAVGVAAIFTGWAYWKYGRR